MSGDHNQFQKDKSYLDFECPRCGHCCQAKGEDQEPLSWTVSTGWVYADDTSENHVDEIAKAEHDKSYERGFVDGMQHQMRSTVDKAINKEPTKIFGPNLEEVLNSAGFYKKREWQGLTGNEARKFYEKYTDREELIHAIDKFLEEKNNG